MAAQSNVESAVSPGPFHSVLTDLDDIGVDYELDGLELGGFSRCRLFGWRGEHPTLSHCSACGAFRSVCDFVPAWRLFLFCGCCF